MRRNIATPERYMLFFGEQYPLNFGFKLRLDAAFDEERAIQTLKSIARRHALLFSHQEYTIGKKKDLVFDENDIPLLVGKAPADKQWEQHLLERMVFRFDPFKGPLFRLDWRNTGKECELFFVFHHGAADGIGTVYFIHDFLTHYAGMNVDVPDTALMPSLYEAMREDIYHELLKRPEPAWKKESPPPPKPYTVAEYSYPDYYLRFFEMSEGGLRRLASEAKAAAETVNSYLGALILKRSAQIFGPKEGYRRTIQCPVDLRQYLKEDYRPIAASYNGIVKVAVDCSMETVEMAACIRKGIADNRAGMKDIEEYFQFRDSFDNVEDPESLMMSFPPDTIDYDFSFSNLGRTIIAPDYNSIRVTEMYGPVFTAVFGETVIGLNTTNGVLRMSLIFSKAIEKAKEYEKLGDAIAEIFASYDSAE